MTTRRRRDSVPVLHNCGPVPREVYVTNAVGVQEVVCPVTLLDGIFDEFGVSTPPTWMYAAHDGVHLHPLLVAAAVECAIVSTTHALQLPVPECHPDLRGIRGPTGRKPGPVRARDVELALDMLARLPALALPLYGRLDLHGVARWNPAVAPARGAWCDDPWVGWREGAEHAVRGLLLLAYASPPICSIRRAPSLDFFRARGALEFRNFGQPHAS